MKASLLRKPALAVFARRPVPGEAKTRLGPLLGLGGAAKLQEALLQDALRKAESLHLVAAPYVYISGSASTLTHLPGIFARREQRGRNLGERLESAFRQLLARHSGVVVMGTDSPVLTPRLLRQAFGELRLCDAVLGPCPDGGYYLVGLRRIVPGLLAGVRWGTRFAFRDTLDRLLRREFFCAVLEPCEDVDRPADLRRLAKRMRADRTARRLAPATWQFVKSVCSLA